jgi:pimeloyl-ACP methyl ester carboxylesterase
VLLVPGFEASSEAWNTVMPTLAGRTRVCTYDRPGTGTSDAPATTQTFETQAADLSSMLETMGEHGPYVIVGHSFGGAQAVEFATRFAADVDALVLVDSSPAGWPTALCAVADGTEAATFIQAMCDGWTDPMNNLEHLDVFAAFDLAAGTPSLGSLPVTIMTAVDRELPPGISDAERTRLTDTWNEGQEHWSRLSSVSRLVSVPDTGHYIQIDRPDLVIDEIARLLP